MAKTKHIKGPYGYSCIDCKYYFDFFSDIFGSCPECQHKPKPKNINEVFDGEEPCIHFDYDVFLPKYNEHCKSRDLYRKK